MPEQKYYLAVKAVITNRQGSILLLRRSPSSRLYPGLWDLPGGKMESGESIDEGLRREIREETMLDVKLTGVVGATEMKLPGKQIAILLFSAFPKNGVKVKLSKEHDRAEWCSVAALDDRKLCPGVDNVRLLLNSTV